MGGGFVQNATNKKDMKRVNDIWCDKLKKWVTKRLGPKPDNDSFDKLNGYISDRNLLYNWYVESTIDGSSVQRQRALRSALIHMNKAKENYANKTRRSNTCLH